MSTTKRFLAIPALLAFAVLPACNSLIDDPDGPHVVLEAENVTIPAVTTETDIAGCTFTITNANATFRNKPKNVPAGTAPFQDITLQGVNVNYTWPSGNITPDRSFGIAGSVPANGSAPAQFMVVAGDDLPTHEGSTANLVLTFFGVTVSGDPVTYTTGGFLNVDSCN